MTSGETPRVAGGRGGDDDGDAAEQDAFLVEWGIEALGDERTAAALLMQCRKWREAREKATR